MGIDFQINTVFETHARRSITVFQLPTSFRLSELVSLERVSPPFEGG